MVNQCQILTIIFDEHFFLGKGKQEIELIITQFSDAFMSNYF
jgi:hypothetical protein